LFTGKTRKNHESWKRGKRQFKEKQLIYLHLTEKKWGGGSVLSLMHENLTVFKIESDSARITLLSFGS